MAGPFAGISVDVRGIDGVQAMLGKWDDKNARKVLRSALRSGGGVVKKSVVAEAPYPDLKKNVWARVSSRQGQIGFVIGHHKRNGGFIWHMVAGGTKAHGPRKAKAIVFYSKKAGRAVVASSVRGVSPNPFVARAYARSEAAAMAKVSQVIDRYLDSL
jgi:hypothetical protein